MDLGGARGAAAVVNAACLGSRRSRVRTPVWQSSVEKKYLPFWNFLLGETKGIDAGHHAGLLLSLPHVFLDIHPG